MKQANGPADPLKGKEMKNSGNGKSYSKNVGKEAAEGSKLHEAMESKVFEKSEKDADSAGVDFVSSDSDSKHPMYHKNLARHQSHVHEAAGFVAKQSK